MKLSEHIILGSVAYQPNDGFQWFGNREIDREEGGCAMGRAWLAAGRTAQEWSEKIFLAPYNGDANKVFAQQWPWLADRDVCGVISHMFFKVADGEATIDAIADYVRSVEPECGECCRFDCVCTVQPQVAEEETVHASQ